MKAALHSHTESGRRDRRVVRDMGQFTPDVTALVERLLKHPSWRVRRSSALALLAEDPEPPAENLRDDTAFGVRQDVAEALDKPSEQLGEPLLIGLLGGRKFRGV